MNSFIEEYVKGCADCQSLKNKTHRQKIPLQPLTTDPDARPFQVVSMDLIVKLPKSKGYDSILVVVDHDCTKAATFIPCNETATANTITQLYLNNVFKRYGLPRCVISDRDPQFVLRFMRELCKKLQIAQNISTAYHPQTDGQTERVNQQLEQYLRFSINGQQNDWADRLPFTEITYNS